MKKVPACRNFLFFPKHAKTLSDGHFQFPKERKEKRRMTATQMAQAANQLVMPAEWEKHAATWMAWPYNSQDWPGKFGPIPWVFAEIVRHLVGYGENVCILVNDAETEKKAEAILWKVLKNLDSVHFSQCEYDRCWLRDTGPIFIRRGRQKLATLWGFNGWAKYPNFRHDAAVGEFIQQEVNIPGIYANGNDTRIVLEGGAIDVDGQGLLIATEECLIPMGKIQERNSGFCQEDYESTFEKYLGVTKTIWLAGGIEGDDTHGHIDDVARFIAPNHVVAAYAPKRHDPNYEVLKENIAILAREGLKITEIPIPSPLYFKGRRLPASYCNFYIANNGILVPTFNDIRDRDALDILAELFPTREVVGIHAVDLVWGFGTIHCLTQQQPA